MKKMLDELLELVPHHAVQISILGDEYVVGWETEHWPYVAARRAESLMGALALAIELAKKHPMAQGAKNARG